MKPSRTNEVGQIVETENPIHVSNVKVIETTKKNNKKETNEKTVKTTKKSTKKEVGGK